MEAGGSYTSLIIVLFAAFLTPIILKKLRLSFIPVVVAEIIAGLMIGQTGFDLVEHGPWIDILSQLGFIFLMFLSGVEIDFSVFTSGKKKKTLPGGKTEPNRFLISLFIFITVLILSFGISLMLVRIGLTDNAYFMSLVISTISMGVVVPTLKESGIVKVGIGQIILIITIIADLVTMILLAVFVSIYGGSGGSKMWLLLIFLVAGAMLYFVGKFFRNRTFFATLTTSTVQIGTRAVFVLIMLLVGLSETVGAEAILGAFVAGALVSLLSPNREMERQLDSFGYGFLIPIFFVMVGVDLNLVRLFKDPTVFILIPLLLVGLYVSKLAPVLLLKWWYGWKTVFGSGLLLTSTLSLVVAAAKIGEEVGVIDKRTASALILLAVVASILAPILFKKVFPLEEAKRSKRRLTIIGANQYTLPMSLELDKDRYQIVYYHATHDRESSSHHDNFHVRGLKDYQIATLEENQAFDAEILVVATANDSLNSSIAEYARASRIEQVIARIEQVALHNHLREKEIQVFSSLLSAKSMLKVMIESPDVADIFTTKENGLFQIDMNRSEFEGVELRHLPFLGDTIIVRIFRDNHSLVPHGDTELKLGDRLIMTGTRSYIDDLRARLS